MPLSTPTILTGVPILNSADEEQTLRSELRTDLGDYAQEMAPLDEPITVEQYVVTYLPNTWALLKTVKQPFPRTKVFKSFVANCVSDDDLPFTPALLEAVVEREVQRMRIQQAQERFLVQEIPKGEHRVYGDTDLTPYVPVERSMPRSGAFGTVVKVTFARDPTTFYARKEVKLDPEDEDTASWYSEISNLSLLDHQHIVQLVCSYQQNGNAYMIISPYAEASLRDFMEKPNSFDWWTNADSRGKVEVTMNWMNCLTAALVYLHDSYIRHRDIKPANILLHFTDEGVQPLITDFGTSKKFSLSEGSRSKAEAGTEFFFAPEQTRNQPAGRKADVFALGATFSLLVAMLNGLETAAIIRRLRFGTRPGFAGNLTDFVIPFLNTLGEDGVFLRNLSTLCRRMMEQDPQSRLAARDVFRQLTRFLAAENFTIHCDTIPRSPLGSQLALEIVETLEAEPEPADIGNWLQLYKRGDDVVGDYLTQRRESETAVAPLGRQPASASGVAEERREAVTAAAPLEQQAASASGKGKGPRSSR